MTSSEIYKKILAITPSEGEYTVFPINEYSYFGIDKHNNIVFIMRSLCRNDISIIQETHSLRFLTNRMCCFDIGNSPIEQSVHILICRAKGEDYVSAFIRLTHAFSCDNDNYDQSSMSKLFTTLSSLFDKERSVSDIKLQGLFGELYAILFFREHGCAIEKYWQSKGKLKFDFSIDDMKKLEIKTTTKQYRLHHFKHDQLLTDIYDIRVVSIMLQKSDSGISLGDLVSAIRKIYSDNFRLLLHVESCVSGASDSLLSGVKYDKQYLENNIKFFDAADIPRFTEKTPEGVYNTEYDCDLENIACLTFEQISAWMII